MDRMRSKTLSAPAFVITGCALVCVVLDTPGPLATAVNAQKAAVQRYRVINSFPHDPDAFTQGLIFRNGYLFESTGQYGRSTLRKVELTSGRVVQQRRLESSHFGEGLAERGGQLVQLTWRAGLGFIYDLSTFEPKRTFKYEGEGWGLTHDERHFILADGTAVLRFLDPNTFREARRLTVTDAGGPVMDLNELEYVRGEIYANVWHTDRIARIAPDSGRVIAWIDLSGLLPRAFQRDAEAVLNGIAYDAVSNRLFVTGKLWPRLFEVQIVP
jgi:glutamine cyclotransferase